MGADFFTPFRIQWVRLVVVGLYAAVHATICTRVRELAGLRTGDPA